MCVVDTVLDVAKEAGLSPAQVSLNWLLQNCDVTSPIIGARKMEHLQDNLKCADRDLSEDQLRRLNEASVIYAPYPYDMVRQNCDC